MTGWVRRLRRWLIYGVLALGLIWAGLFLFLAPALPDTRDLRQMRKSPGITVVAADGSILLRRGAFNGVFLPLSALPPHMAQAVIATEDRRFYSHFGMDVVGFARALWANIRAGRVVQGGSTISQWVEKYGRKGTRHKLIVIQSPDEQNQVKQMKQRISQLERVVAQLTLDKLMLESTIQVAEDKWDLDLKKGAVVTS